MICLQSPGNPKVLPSLKSLPRFITAAQRAESSGIWVCRLCFKKGFSYALCSLAGGHKSPFFRPKLFGSRAVGPNVC